MDRELAKLLERKRDQIQSARRIDWDDRRDQFLAAVDALYQWVEAELAEAIADRTIQTQRRPKNLTESFLGTYSVDDLILFVGDEQVRFSPRGRNIVGAEGRIDVVGERSEATLLLHAGAWHLVQARQPTLHTIRLDGSALAPLLDLVMRS